MRLLFLVIIFLGAFAAPPALANEWDDAISRFLVIPKLLYEQKEEKWRTCLTAHSSEERLAALSHWVVRDRGLVAEAREQIVLFKARRAKGENVDPLVEANTIRWLPEYEKSLEQSWVGYKNAGGTAGSIDQVVIIDSPCGSPPARPTY